MLKLQAAAEPRQCFIDEIHNCHKCNYINNNICDDFDRKDCSFSSSLDDIVFGSGNKTSL